MVERTISGVRVPTYDEMLWPTLLALKELGGSATNQEIEAKVIELAGYADEQLAVSHGNTDQSEIAYRLAWARTYLKAVGALINSGRGVWAITDEGRNLTLADMESIPRQVRAQPRRARNGQRNSADEGSADAASMSSHSFSSTRSEEWTDRLLSVLQTMPPASFERLCQRVLRESGFIKVEVTGRSGDGGIDGIGVLRISLLSFQVFFSASDTRAASARRRSGTFVARWSGEPTRVC